MSHAPTAPPASPPPAPMALTAWLIVIMAAIGFAFDIYELLMLPLILGPAVQELGSSVLASAVDAIAYGGRRYRDGRLERHRLGALH